MVKSPWEAKNMEEKWTGQKTPFLPTDDFHTKLCPDIVNEGPYELCKNTTILELI